MHLRPCAHFLLPHILKCIITHKDSNINYAKRILWTYDPCTDDAHSGYGRRVIPFGIICLLKNVNLAIVDAPNVATCCGYIIHMLVQISIGSRIYTIRLLWRSYSLALRLCVVYMNRIQQFPQLENNDYLSALLVSTNCVVGWWP